LPRVFACVFDRCGISVPHHCQRSQQVRLPAQRHLLLVLHNLKCQGVVSRVLFNLVLHLGLRVAPYNQQRGAGKRCSEEHE